MNYEISKYNNNNDNLTNKYTSNDLSKNSIITLSSSRYNSNKKVIQKDSSNKESTNNLCRTFSCNENIKSLEVIDYVIQKLDFRNNIIRRSRYAITNLYTLNDFINFKKDIFKMFEDTEDDISQGIEGLKTMLRVHEDINEELNNISYRYYTTESQLTEEKNEKNNIINKIFEQENLISKLNNIINENNLSLKEYEKCNLEFIESKKQLLKKIDCMNSLIEEKNNELIKIKNFIYKGDVVYNLKEHLLINNNEKNNNRDKETEDININNFDIDNSLSKNHNLNNLNKNSCIRPYSETNNLRMLINKTNKSKQLITNNINKTLNYHIESFTIDVFSLNSSEEFKIKKSKIIENINKDNSKLIYITNLYGIYILKEIKDGNISFNLLNDIEKSLMQYEHLKCKNKSKISSSYNNKNNLNTKKDIDKKYFKSCVNNTTTSLIDNSKLHALTDISSNNTKDNLHENLYNIDEADVEDEIITKAPKLIKLNIYNSNYKKKRNILLKSSINKSKSLNKLSNYVASSKPILKGGVNFEKCLREYSSNNTCTSSKSCNKNDAYASDMYLSSNYINIKNYNIYNKNKSNFTNKDIIKKDFNRYTSNFGKLFDKGILYNGISDLDKSYILNNIIDTSRKLVDDNLQKTLFNKNRIRLLRSPFDDNIENYILKDSSDLLNSQIKVDNTSNIKIEDETDIDIDNENENINNLYSNNRYSNNNKNLNPNNEIDNNRVVDESNNIDSNADLINNNNNSFNNKDDISGDLNIE